MVQCQNAYGALSQRSYESPPAFTLPPRKPKRPLPGEPSVTTERVLQPRPVTFASVNGPDQVSPVFDDGKPRKKRGRPSKEEHDRRVAEAEARGEIYPKPRKPKTPRPSMEGQGVETVEVLGGGAPTAMMFTPSKNILNTPTSATNFPDITIAEGSAVSAGQVSHEEQRAADSMTTRSQMEVPVPKEDHMTGSRKHNASMAESRASQLAISGVTSTSRLAPAPQMTYGAHGLPMPEYQMHRPLMPQPATQESPVLPAPVHHHQMPEQPQIAETPAQQAQPNPEQTQEEQRRESHMHQAQMQEARTMEDQRQK